MRYLITILFLISYNSRAQCPSYQQFGSSWVSGNFTINDSNQVIQCSGQPIFVKTSSTIENARYIFEYNTPNDTSFATQVNFYTYSKPGYYNIVQIGTVNGKPSLACKTIFVLTTPIPTFTLSNCDSSTAKIVINSSDTDYNEYLIDWGDGRASQIFGVNQNTISYSYSSTGTYKIKITGNVKLTNCSNVSASQTFTATAASLIIPTFLTSEVKNDLSAELVYKSSHTTLPFTLNQRIFPSTNFSQIIPLPISNGLDWKIKLDALQTNVHTYCYTFSQTKQCSGIATYNSSNEVYTLPLTIRSEPNQNILNWKIYPSTTFKRYNIKRDGMVIANINSNFIISYIDSNVVCGQSYQYQVIAETNDITSSSANVTIKTEPNEVPPPLRNTFVSIVNNKPLISVLSLPIDVSKLQNYIISTSNSTFNTIQNLYTDSISNPSKEALCYKVSYKDVCNKTPASQPEICTIFLQVQNGELVWSSMSPFNSQIIMYTVEKTTSDGIVIATYDIGTSTTWPIDFTDTNTEVIYRIRATSTDGQMSTSNTILFQRSANLFVPDTFSPNNDLLNDTFDIKGQSIEQGQVSIYDRWGNILFHTTDWKKGWDGTDANGRNVPPGFYTYRIEYADTQKNAYTKRGTVSLLR